MDNLTPPQKVVRQPVIAVMGHIDHGKSTLLDYIRKTHVVDSEAGGITQHLSAYEVTHTDSTGTPRHITFLDTPGHEAFQSMRSRGATVADIVILVVSAEDGVKAQTKEALKAIQQAKIPYIVAITKIDKTNADVERVKMNLIENEIYIEGFGGDTPYVAVSAKTGKGVSELLDMMLLVADIAELTYDPNKKAEGIVIEAHRDPKRGIAATLLIKDGTLNPGEYVVSGSVIAPLRIVEDFAGNKRNEASAGSPISVIGFSDVPEVGATFVAVTTKKEAEDLAREAIHVLPNDGAETGDDRMVLPIIIKADALGSIDAIKHEIGKIDQSRVSLRTVHASVGDINESDVQRAVADAGNALVVGFGVGMDAAAREVARRDGVTTHTFTIIYELAEWIAKEAKERTPMRSTNVEVSYSKILKVFSSVRNTYVLGARVERGTLTKKSTVHLMRNNEEVGKGTIEGLQAQKQATTSVSQGQECGVQVTLSSAPQPGDYMAAFETQED